MSTVWAWLTDWNWSQLLPDMVVATVTGLAVAVALQWSARRTEKRQARERAVDALSPYSLTLEMELADGVRFEPIGSGETVSLRPAREFREMVERARSLERDLDQRAMKEARQTIFLEHICTHLDTMQREGAKIEHEAAASLRRAAEGDANAVRLRVNALRHAILEPDASEEAIVAAFPDVFTDEILGIPDDGRSHRLGDHLRFYLTSRYVADTAARAYASFCLSTREAAFTKSLEIISTPEHVRELRQSRRDILKSGEERFQAAIDEVQRYAGGC